MADTSGSRVLRITLKRSGIGCPRYQRETLRALRLTRLGKTTTRHDSPSLQGRLRTVQHLIEVCNHGS